MRKSLGAFVVVFFLSLLAACGTSGGGSEASDTTAAGSDTTEATDTTESSDTTEGSDTTEAPDTTEGSDSGDGDTVPVEDWAEGFCGDFSDWIDEIETLSGNVQDGVTPGDVEGAKAAIVDLFSKVADETEDLQASITDGAAPDVEDGDQFVADLAEKFQGFIDETRDAADAAEGVSTTDAAAFQSEINTLVTDFQTNINEVGNAFGELDAIYDDPELQSALTSACSF